MKQNPDAKLPLPIEVTDQDASENTGSILIYLDPKRLGLDSPDKAEPKGPVQVSQGEAEEVNRRKEAIKKVVSRKLAPQPVAPRQNRASAPQRQAEEQRQPNAGADESSSTDARRKGKKGEAAGTEEGAAQGPPRQL